MNAQPAYAQSLQHSFGLAVVGISKQLGLKTEQLARVLGISPLECARLLSGRESVCPEDTLVARFAQLADIHRGLARLFEHDLVHMRQWLHLPSDSFPQTPLSTMHSAEGLDKVLERVGELLTIRKSAKKVIYI